MSENRYPECFALEHVVKATKRQDHPKTLESWKSLIIVPFRLILSSLLPSVLQLEAVTDTLGISVMTNSCGWSSLSIIVSSVPGKALSLSVTDCMSSGSLFHRPFLAPHGIYRHRPPS